MIVHLLLAHLKFRSKSGWSLQEMMQLIRLNIFKRTDLEAFFNPPDKM
jgi:hypothetical protein